MKDPRFIMISNCIPNINAFMLPERGEQLNLGLTYPLNRPCDDVLMNSKHRDSTTQETDR